MEKCKNLFIYEQVGNRNLITCKLEVGKCEHQGKEFNSSSDSKRYIVCKTKGLIENKLE